MLISEFIKKLERAKEQYGDLPLTTWDGNVRSVKFCGTVDGISYPIDEDEINEISMEIWAE